MFCCPVVLTLIARFGARAVPDPFKATTGLASCTPGHAARGERVRIVPVGVDVHDRRSLAENRLRIHAGAARQSVPSVADRSRARAETSCRPS